MVTLAEPVPGLSDASRARYVGLVLQGGRVRLVAFLASADLRPAVLAWGRPVGFAFGETSAELWTCGPSAAARLYPSPDVPTLVELLHLDGSDAAGLSIASLASAYRSAAPPWFAVRESLSFPAATSSGAFPFPAATMDTTANGWESSAGVRGAPLERGDTWEIYDAPRAAGGRAIRCLRCFQLSYHPGDVGALYCVRCGSFHQAAPGGAPEGLIDGGGN